MEKRLKLLMWSLVMPVILITALGVYLKYWTLGDDDRYRDKAAAAIPFALMGDRETLDMLLTPQPVTPEWTLPEAVTAVDILPEPTEPPTDPPETVPPETTVPETIPPYTFNVSLNDTGKPEFSFDGPRVEDEWFENTLFIGDSRTCTLRDLARSGNADYFCKVGLSVFSVGYEKCGDRKFPEQKIAALLDSGTYHKVFISLGLNEAGYKLEDLLNKYGDLISLIQEKQPGVKIILQGIMTVSRGKANSDRAFSLENLGRINEGIAAMADGEQIFYIDVNEIFADEEGYLLDGLSGDGCHLYGKYGVVWEDWIRYASAQLEIE